MMARSWNLLAGGIFMLAGIVFLVVMYYRWRHDRDIKQLPPTLPSLPAVLPSYLFDNSETPRPEDGGKPLTYCPTCWIRDVALVGSAWALPAGTPLFCLEHAYTTLARALMARAQEQQNNQQQTGDRSL